ncbi:MAG: NADH-quinone oxidoreductase subunit J [Bacteroidales bacterium]|nr:NADH-quinone oxidoreductase subunit J [Bacteroidales bacterium]MCF8457281.1 NADH-quinone oxidoreductase subunit J [Bacteroidales bacterium]
MSIHELMFYLFSGMILLFSVLTVTSRRILRAATYLLFVLISTAGIYFMLNYQFLAAVQLTLYAGGIVVLIIFSILLTSHITHKFEPIGIKKMVFTIVAVAAGAILTITTVLNYGFNTVVASSQNPDMQLIGGSLLGYGRDGYALPFEVISVLLLAAIFGSIVIAKKEKSK